MNLNQGTKEKMRKTHRSICDKGIQKCTSLNRNNVQMKDEPDRMARKKRDNESQLTREK